jgi:hypothetical protein
VNLNSFASMIKSLDRFSLASFLLPTSFILIIFCFTPYFFQNQYDDSYITYRYAANLANGDGLVFNPSEKADAASAFLYTLILALFWKLGIHNLEVVGGVIGLAALSFTCYQTFRIARHLCGSEPVALGVSGLCGVNGFFSTWALSGMETMLWAASITYAIRLLLEKESDFKVIFCIAVASFIRLEGIFLLVAYFLESYKNGRLKLALGYGAGLITAFFLFYAVKYNFYGVWISHAYQMKRIHEYYQPSSTRVLFDWFLFGSVPALIGCLSLLKKEFLPIGCYVFLSFFVVFAGPFSDWSRYSVHLLPILWAFSAITISKLMLSRNAYLAFGLILVATLQTSFSTAVSWKNMTAQAQHQTCRREVGMYLRDQVNSGKVIVSSDIGMIGFVALSHRFIDLAGLTSPDILDNYKNGRHADSVLLSKRAEIVADTFSVRGESALDFVRRNFPVVEEDSEFVVSDEQPLFLCEAENIRFGVRRLLKQ